VVVSSIIPAKSCVASEESLIRIVLSDLSSRSDSFVRKALMSILSTIWPSGPWIDE